ARQSRVSEVSRYLPAMRIPLLACAVLVAACSGDKGPDNTTPPGPVDPSQIFPSDNDWNRDVSGDDVDPNSDNYIAEMAPTTDLHADFSNIVDGDYGIPYVVVPGDQPKVPITFTDYPNESDPGPYPIPPDAPIEGMGQGDAHVIAVDLTNKMLYEMFTA